MAFFVAVLVILSVTTSTSGNGILSLQMGTEYLYSYFAKSELEKAGTYFAKSKIGIEVLNKTDKQYKCRLNMYSYVLELKKDGTHYSGNHQELDYEKQFHFNLNQHGEINKVFYPEHENLTVLAAKKSLLGTLSARLHESSRDQSKTWSYTINETDHQGAHNATYSVEKTEDKLTFRKVKQPSLKHNTKSHNSRIIEFDRTMKIPKVVTFKDEFSTAKKPPEGFDPHEGMNLAKNVIRHGAQDEFDVPQMSGRAEGRLILTAQRPSRNYGDSSELNLKEDNLLIGKIPEPIKPLAEQRLHVVGNLTCMENAPKESNEKINCYHQLVKTMTQLSDADLSNLAADYLSFPNNRKSTSYTDQENMIDAVGTVGTGHALHLITSLVLKSNAAPPGMLSRALLHFMDFENPLPTDVLAELERRTFRDQYVFPDKQETYQVNNRMRLIFGIVVKKMRTLDPDWSLRMTRKLEDSLGVYDPWHHRQKRSTLGEEDFEYHVQNKATLILSLGNAEAEGSVDHLTSYVNNSDSPNPCRLAAISSLGRIKTQKAADILLSSVLREDTDHIYNAALLAYSQHPLAELRNFHPESLRGKNSSNLQINVHPRALHRVRRSFKSAVARVWKGFQFHLKLPGYNWIKAVGGSAVGASFGIKMNNLLDLNIQPLRGHLIVDVYDGAFATLHLGIIGMNLHLVKAEICFKGSIRYQVNILKEYGHDDVERFAKLYDNVVNKVVLTIKNAIKRFKTLIDTSKGTSLSNIFKRLIDAIEDLPNRVGGLQGLSRKLIRKLGKFADPPPIVEAVKNVIVRVTTLFNDIKTDVMEFYNSIVDAVKVTLPWAWEQIKKAVDGIIKAIEGLLTDPKRAIGDIAKAIVRVVAAIQGIISAKDRIADACFFTEGNRPYWFDIKTEASGIIDDIKKVRVAVTDTIAWIKQGFKSEDPALFFTGVSTSTMRQHILDTLLSVLDEAIGPFKEILNDLAAPFIAAYELVFETIKDIKEAYNAIKNAYQESKGLIDKLFGPKVSQDFPRKYLESDDCGDGFYPSTGRGAAYKHTGVDAEKEIGSQIVSPFKGTARVSGTNEVTIATDEIDNVEVILNNVKLNSQFDGVPVFKGQKIGVVTLPRHCSTGHIHFSMRKTGSSKYIDTSKYMERRQMPPPKWIEECNHYLLIYLGRTISYGKVTGKPDEKDTSPERDLPDVSDLPDVDSNSGRRKRDASQFFNKALNFTKALGIKAINSLGPLFNLNMYKLTLKDVITFLEETGKTELKEKLDILFSKLSKSVNGDRCARPDSLSDDQLRALMIQQGKSTSGARKALIKRYVQSDSACQGLQNILTKNAYCRFNKACTGIVCCLDVKLFSFYKSFTAFATYNPCTFQISLGVERWTKSYVLHDPNFSITKKHSTILDLNIIDPIQIVVEYRIEKSGNTIKITFTIRVCSTENDICLAPIKLLDNAVITIKGCADPNKISQDEKLSISEKSSGTSQFKDMNIAEFIKLIGFMDIDPKTVAKTVSEIRDLYLEMVKSKIDTAISKIFGDTFKNYDVCLDGYTLKFGPYHKKFFSFCTPPIMLGPIPLTFCFGAGGSYGVIFNTKLCLLTMKSVTTVTPSVGAQAWGSLGVSLWVFRAELHLRGYILTTSFPTRVDIYFTKFPLDVRSRMDIVLVPLRLELRARLIVKICFWKCFKKTLINVLLWAYSTPAIRGEVFNINDAEPDETPPDFSLYEGSDVGRTERAVSTSSCTVYQLAGHDYTEPAFNLELNVDDDRSEVTMTFCVGRFRGGCDVANGNPLGGSSSVVSQKLIGGVPLYFTVTAANSGGKTAQATCYLSNYDVTLPGGRVTGDFRFTSNPRILRASALVLDDSKLMMQKEGVGYSRGVYGDQVVAWNNVDINKAWSPVNTGHDPLGLRTLEHFAVPREGKLMSVPVKVSYYPAPQSCAQECLTYSATKCQSFNYDYDSPGTCEILEEIEGDGVEMHKRGAFHNFERLGIGHTVVFSHEDLALLHNNLYYFNLMLKNNLGYENILTSVPILADFTTPDTGYCPNPLRNQTLHEKCEDFVHDPWEGRCVGVTSLPNHRYVIDGDKCRTVFNGHTPMTELLYTRANRMVTANWDGFHDDQTGIHGYTWSAGTRHCEDDIHPHKNPHAHLFHESEWTHTGLAFPLDLKDGHYHVSVRAFNKVDFGGPLATTVCHTVPLAIDNTPPFVHSVTNVRYDDQTHLITAEFNISDPLSHIREADFGLGMSNRDTYLLDWQRQQNTTHLEYKFKVPDGVPTWVKIRAINNVDLRTTGHASAPIIIDTSPPIGGQVNDGPVKGVDQDFQHSPTEICSNWNGFFDEESGISKYSWGIGLTAGSDDVIAFTDLSHKVLTHCGSATLQHKTTYHATVIAFNGGAVPRNVTVTSDGVLVDSTPPVEGWVKDGLDTKKDMQYSSSASTVSANWDDYVDPESGIQGYHVEIHRKHMDQGNTTFEDQIIHEAVDLKKDKQSIELHHFHLHDGDRVHVILTATNQAGATTVTTSDGFVLDMSDPVMPFLGDGDQLNQDKTFTLSKTHLSANWIFSDPQSGIDHYKVSIFEKRHGANRIIYPVGTEKPWIIVGGQVNTWTVGTALNLHDGAQYSIRVSAVNGAGLSTVHNTDGVIVDSTPPEMIYIHVGVVTGESEEVIDGFVEHNDENGLQVAWRGMDHQSGIAGYWLSIGTAPKKHDIMDFMSMGTSEDGYIKVKLNITDPSSGVPIYYVNVKAENNAGAYSQQLTSSPIKVLPGDVTGQVYDGARELFRDGSDVDFQRDTTAFTMHFRQFESAKDGISGLEWGVGSKPLQDDILPFSSVGVVFDQSMSNPGSGLPGSGKAVGLVPLPPGQKFHATVRAITGAGKVLEATTDGVTVDTTPPKLTIDSISVGTENSSLTLSEEASFYQKSGDFISASWNVTEKESEISSLTFSYGTFPGADDVYNVTDVTKRDSVPTALVKPNSAGKPNIFTLTAKNKVGLKQSATSASLTIDTTTPIQGTVKCPNHVSVGGGIRCEWKGFFDQESNIQEFRFAVGTVEGDSSVHGFVSLPPTTREIFVRDFTGAGLQHQSVYYATVIAVNGVGEEVLAYSSQIYVDNTPPKVGKVIELDGVSEVDLSARKRRAGQSGITCDNDQDCISSRSKCQKSLTTVLVAWAPFEDAETGITRYEVGIGTTAGGTQLSGFQAVPDGQRYFLVENLDLVEVSQIFSSVRATNGAGLVSVATSDGIYISRISSGLQPLREAYVYDGREPGKDLDFQFDNEQITGHWDFGGDPCPIDKYEWSVLRLDGSYVLSFTALPKGQTYGVLDELRLVDGETYFIVVRSTNLLGHTYSKRSDGITVKLEPLVPGDVRDGHVIGTDLNFQPSVTRLSTNWDRFGRDRQKDGVINTGDKTNVDAEIGTHQGIDHYEVALGTDRGFPRTRTNIHPFINVGLNRTWTFNDLKLIPRTATYYVTVRAYSVSTAMAEVTSNGIKVGYGGHAVKIGELKLSRFINSDKKLSFSWKGFLFAMPVMFYQWGIGTTTDQLSSLTCDQLQNYEAGTVKANPLYKHLFDIKSLRNSGKDSAVELKDLKLVHNATYHVVVIATDESAECSMVTGEFTVDLTPPVEGHVKVGAYLESGVSSTSTTDRLTVEWDGYSDDVSGLKYYKLGLFEGTPCAGQGNKYTQIVDYIQIPTTYVNFTIVDLNLQSDRPYSVRLLAENNAGSTVLTKLQPLLVDSKDPVAGDVKDGGDFKKDIRFQSDTTSLHGVLMHLPKMAVNPCSSRVFPMTSESPSWKNPLSKGLKGNVIQHKVEFMSKQIQYDTSDGLSITLLRDIRKERMLSGSLYSKLDDKYEGTYKFDIKATKGHFGGITGLTYWEGGIREFVLLDTTFTDSQNTNCSCCTENKNNSLCPCDCLNTTTAPTTETNTAQTTESKIKSFGIQIHTGVDTDGEKVHYLVVWSRSDDPLEETQSEKLKLYFNPSDAWHEYEIRITNDQDDICAFQVFIDGALSGSISGFTCLKSEVYVGVAAWVRNGEAVAIADPFNPPMDQAFIKNIMLPPEQDAPCRYGKFFSQVDKPIVKFLAGVGTSPSTDDVVPFQTVAIPCLPCLNPCDALFCNNSCDTHKVSQISFKLDGLDLESSVMASRNGSLVSTPARYLIVVKAVTGSGRSVIAASSGVYIDVSPPIFESLYHIDVTWSNDEPVEYQGTDSVISVKWDAYDKESKIVEYFWEIGKTPDGSEILNQTSVGLNTSAVMSGLKLTNNKTYHVTVRARNGAGLEQRNLTSGVTVLLTPPTVSVVPKIENSEPLGGDVYPPDMVKTERQDSLSFEWGNMQDKTIHEVYFSVESVDQDGDSGSNDIVPRQLVSLDGNRGGDVKIENGQLFSGSSVIGNLSDARPQGNGTESKPKTTTGFKMEPGKSMRVVLTVCNKAHKCTRLKKKTMSIIRKGDKVTTFKNGSLAPIKLKLSTSQQVNIAAERASRDGTTIVIGELTDKDLNEEYSSAAAANYKPYIVNPDKTVNKTSRFLKRRIRRWYGTSFYLNILGGQRLTAPLVIKVSFDKNDIEGFLKGYTPRLLFWDKENEMWKDASETCETPSIQYDWDNGTVTTRVCGSTTDQQTGRSKRAAPSTGPAGSQQFAVSSVSNQFQNYPPVITGSLYVNRFEDISILDMYLTATDPDGDRVSFRLNNTALDTSKGNITLDTTGRLKFFPCLDCHGDVKVPFIVTEQRFDGNPALSTPGTFHISLLPVNDNPEILVVRGGTNIVRTTNVGKEAQLTVEQRVITNAAYKDLVFYVGTYDVDKNDSLSFLVQPPGNGTLERYNFTNVKFDDQDCQVPWTNRSGIWEELRNSAFNMSDDVLIPKPCDLVLPHPYTELTWAFVLFVYKPDVGFYGSDTLKVFSRDRMSAFSDLLTVTVHVLENPCEHNGTCLGPINDVACEHEKRSQGFRGYSCLCPVGFTGSHCETDIDDCANVTCPDNFTCIDAVNDYTCFCDPTWPCSVSEYLKWEQVVAIIGSISGFVLLIIIVVATVILFRKRKKVGNDDTASSEDSHSTYADSAHGSPLIWSRYLRDFIAKEPLPVQSRMTFVNPAYWRSKPQEQKRLQRQPFYDLREYSERGTPPVMHSYEPPPDY